MSLKALTHRDSGVEIVPQTPADWDDWVSASATRNFAMNDPLLDWLNLYGEAKGFRRDHEYLVRRQQVPESCRLCAYNQICPYTASRE